MLIAASTFAATVVISRFCHDTICPNLRAKPRGSERLQLNRQPFTALEATGLEHPSPAFSTHASPKAVHPAAAPLFGLISSFRHDALSSLGMSV